MSDEPGAVEATFEELLARCIEARAGGDSTLLERLLGEHADLAPRVRARLEDLESLGLLDALEIPPTEVAGHRILAQLGRGGMGAVYLAEERGSGRRVALKLAGSHLEQGPAGSRARARFEREVRTIAQLDHPGIVAVHASGEHDGRPWFSMEHVRGALLARVIERLRARGEPPEVLTAAAARAAVAAEMAAAPLAEPHDPDEGQGAAAWSGSYVSWCCRVVRDVAVALEHAHARGVVHRDVKPSNVLVRPDGRALLFDFGLAHVVDQPTLTRSGDFAGTPYAVAPEQVEARRGAIEARTDVWGLGVVLYELLTLRRPFEAAGPAALLRRVLDDDPLPLRRLHPGLPAALENVCATALEKSPARRYASASALDQDLTCFLAGQPVQARGASLRRRLARFVGRRPAAAAGLALALVVVLGVPAGLLAANAVVREHARLAERAAEAAGELAQAKAEVVDYLVDLFEPLEEGTAAADPGLLALLEAQAQRLEVGLGDQPLARAALLEATGTVYANLGQPQRARPLFDRALALRQTELGERHPDTAALLGRLAEASIELGDAEAGLGLCRRALAAIDGLEGLSAELPIRLRVSEARALAAKGRVDEAAAALAGVFALARESDVEADTTADVLEELARVEHQRGDPAQALRRCQESLALRRAAWLPDPRALAGGLDLHAELLARLGDGGSAAAAAEEAQALRAALRAPPATALPAELVLSDPSAEPFAASFQGGITALQARRLDEARRHFEAALALRPGDETCLYNLACTQALAGDVEAALGWLERAAARGFGAAAEQLELVRRDADLASLRADTRFETLVTRLEEQGRALRARLRAPSVYEPADLADARRPPLLIVLHAEGSTSEQVVQGPWRRVADALGCVLLAPSAPRPLGPSPGDGFAWVDDLEDFAREPWRQEAACAEAIGAFLASREVDRARVLVAGEGGGALVAFDLALRAPGLVRGVLLVQGPALVQVPATRARTAAALGLRAAALLAPGVPPSWVDPSVPGEAYAAALADWLAGQGLGGSVGALPDEPEARTAALVEALRGLGG
jgi:serine/threonine protein kinase/tetratricopeptide (TPR) repeat protein/poly(3-hydroxybutyrate) depolymerase